MLKKYIVTWDMLQLYTLKLAKKIIRIRQWEGIVAISRGGLIPAALLARELGVRFVDTICISSYEHNCKGNIKIIKKTKDYGKNIIIVDDLIDTGSTAKIVKSLYPHSYFVVVFAKPKGKLLIDNYVISVDQNIWIEPPWDMGLKYRLPLIQLL
ncbi:xanthine phosphoribosyltransferase [Buchnera aphidicola (Thelaxes californica)]|uniref:Xanthine phosphoribosyltransferase n=1 Tax=Buchnera aphidicola (Thelaxes californica) TaxID=1315998 RepID=A0A4D6YBG8_9GAMM|nr:xanthine phosphoribosyltransferase [Buchnera aphidicola]QCI26729.1 xanthine phosphoribosyltransferase [Buchnera aphidicola (Thelaxes californica)]